MPTNRHITMEQVIMITRETNKWILVAGAGYSLGAVPREGPPMLKEKGTSIPAKIFTYC